MFLATSHHWMFDLRSASISSTASWRYSCLAVDLHFLKTWRSSGLLEWVHLWRSWCWLLESSSTIIFDWWTCFDIVGVSSRGWKRSSSAICELVQITEIFSRASERFIRLLLRFGLDSYQAPRRLMNLPPHRSWPIYWWALGSQGSSHYTSNNLRTNPQYPSATPPANCCPAANVIQQSQSSTSRSVLVALLSPLHCLLCFVIAPESAISSFISQFDIQINSIHILTSLPADTSTPLSFSKSIIPCFL